MTHLRHSCLKTCLVQLALLNQSIVILLCLVWRLQEQHLLNKQPHKVLRDFRLHRVTHRTCYVMVNTRERSQRNNKPCSYKTHKVKTSYELYAQLIDSVVTPMSCGGSLTCDQSKADMLHAECVVYNTISRFSCAKTVQQYGIQNLHMILQLGCMCLTNTTEGMA